MDDHVGNEEANRLYWETDVPVADIATRLDLSRRGLYDAVHPVEAGFDCEECGDGLQYENRSARRQGNATCPACGATRSITEEPEAPARFAADNGDARGDARDFIRDPDIRHRAVVLGGAAIAGVAIGTVAALIALRRD